MLGNILGYSVFIAYGLWLAIFPNSVIKFYIRFHRGRGRQQMPKPSVIRILGIILTVFLVFFFIFSSNKK
jgi:hypothetical protein